MTVLPDNNLVQYIHHLLTNLVSPRQGILNLFLQVLDEGFLTDGLGRKVDFKNSIIIATSNAGYQIILNALKAKTVWSGVKDKLLDYLFENAIFRPEFINRFDAVVVFQPLSKENLLDIAELMFQKMKKNLKEKGIEREVEINQASLQMLQKEIKNLGDVKIKIASLKQGSASAILELILAGALQNEASDIHWESQEEGSLLRFRIDGLLQEITFLPSKITSLVLSRLKLISGVALNIKDKPQDGRFTIEVNSLNSEVRASFVPSPNGENVVLRLLNPKTINLTLKDLGLRQDSYEILKKEIKRPNGLIVTTGPTGSGKTTTLYAFLKEILDPKIKIITLEDPIEYHLKGITQTQVEPERGYTFVQGLRAVLRQDPDIIMVGEIRDQETAEIAIQAALTGHLVFSTLHTNDAAGAIPRFLDLDANPKSLASALTLTMAQRLVRRLCIKCKKDYQPNQKEKEKIKKALADLPAEVLTKAGLPSNIKIPKISENFKLFKPTGCPQCNGTGFKGRIGVYEIIPSDPDLEKFISQTPGHAEILEFLQKKGFVSMFQDGVLKALEGITSIEELENVVGER